MGLSSSMMSPAAADRPAAGRADLDGWQEVRLPAGKDRAPGVWPLLALIAAGVSLLFALPMLAVTRPTALAYCAECALRRETRSWTLRGTEITLRSRNEEVPTLVSAALIHKRVVGAHAHRWLEPRLAANPLNPYAPPVILSLGFIDTPLVAAFLTNLGDWADPAMARDTRQLVLRPEYSYLVNHSLRFLRFPPRGFPDRRQFQDWWTQNGFGLYSHLREETEPD